MSHVNVNQTGFEKASLLSIKRSLFYKCCILKTGFDGNRWSLLQHTQAFTQRHAVHLIFLNVYVEKPGNDVVMITVKMLRMNVWLLGCTHVYFLVLFHFYSPSVVLSHYSQCYSTSRTPCFFFLLSSLTNVPFLLFFLSLSLSPSPTRFFT